MAETHLRASQEAILSYTRGRMGIAAVPGSGKTWTLSHLAARLILTTDLKEDQEILVVTFSNSAADNFAARIGNFLKDYGLMPGLGYRVRTLHGLANDILHMRPELSGLSENYTIIDESVSQDIFDEIVSNWYNANPDALDNLVIKSSSEKKRQTNVLNLLKSIAKSFISTAKDLRLEPQTLFDSAAEKGVSDPIIELCLEVYRQYQSRLAYLGSVDFNDLIRLAYQSLEVDPTLVSQLSFKWPFILEDEAQDSSVLQQEILSLLTSQTGNWVRVGDPNQAINESFTTSKPSLLRTFIADSTVTSYDLPESGRSAPAIIALANQLNTWTQTRHPNMYVRDALANPQIEPTKPDDPQKNPPDSPDVVVINDRKFTSDQEVEFIARHAAEWLHENPDKTVAILAFTNNHITRFIKALQIEGVKVVDALLNVPKSTQDTVGTVTHVLNHLLKPTNVKLLGRAFRAFYRSEYKNDETRQKIEELQNALERLSATESFLYPADQQELSTILNQALSENDEKKLIEFRDSARRWHAAAALSLDQCILTIALDLELEPFEISTLYRLATLIKELSEQNHYLDRESLLKEITNIAKNERRFNGYSESDEGFDPSQYPGAVTLATMHKAKGLEWDKVYLVSANNYDYPSGGELDQYRGESFFIKDNRNLEAEAVEAVHFLASGNAELTLDPQQIAYQARLDVIRERLRLLYVGITRAKEQLYISWNTGKFDRNQQALAVQMLSQYMKDKANEYG